MSIFNTVPQTRISRSRHNLSHQVKASFDAGKLIPLMSELAFPGDSWRVALEQFIRTMPMIAPVMDQVDVKVDAFFVPLRLIWDDFEDFITLGLTGEFEAQHPTISRTSAVDAETWNAFAGVGSLADYLNFPDHSITGTANPNQSYDALPFRAYQLIYNEYYLNENLDTPIPIITSSGDSSLSFGALTEPRNFAHFNLKSRGWRKDYFTSALPYPQKGPSVRVPTADFGVNIESNGDLRLKSTDPENNPLDTEDSQYYLFGMVNGGSGTPAAARTATPYGENANGDNAFFEYASGLKGSVSQVDLPTIEELRYAETLQEFYEAQARGGTRPKEYYLNIWHTRSKDSRLDRPEYLGGYRGPITISDIDQTSVSAATAQGNLAGKGVSAGGSRLFKYHVPEWGIIMVIMSVQPKSSYYQGTRRWNLYNDVFDFPNPFFANLGEQPILNQEIYDDPSDNENSGTFGYTPRYAEAKFIPSSVHGQFRTTLDYWHLARKFGSRPHLNSAFIHVNPQEVARIFPNQVSNNDKFIGTFFFHVDRKMYLPYYGVPRLIHSV